MDRINKVKKTLLIVAIAIMIICAITVISYAVGSPDSYRVGGKIDLKYTDLVNDGRTKLFCIEHNEHFPNNLIRFEVVSKIKIDGFDSFDLGDSGNQINGENTAARLAAGIYYADPGEEGHATFNNPGDRQKAVWYYLKPWMKVMISNNIDGNSILGGLNKNLANSNNVGLDNDIIKKVDKYVDNLKKGKNSVYVTNNTKQEDLSVGSETYNNISYTKISGYNASFGPKLHKITVKGKKGNSNTVETINNIKIKQDKEVFDDVSKIISGVSFSILIPTSENVSEITSIKLETEGTLSKIIAKFAFLEAKINLETNKKIDGSNQQNLCIAKAHIESETLYDSESLPGIKLKGNLIIEKVDKNNHDIKLPDVKFTLTNSSGHYVTQSGQITSTYSEINLGPYGKVSISNIPVGTYTLTEKSNPNYGYDVNPNGISVNVGTGDNSVTVENEQKYVYISGKVWEEEKSGKDSVVINNVLDGNDYILGEHTDSNNLWLDNIKVYLKKYERDSNGNRTGNVYTIDQHTTWGGYYRFPGNNSNYNIEIANLKDYFIEFEYNGLTYECVRSGEGGLWENPNSSTAREDAMRDNNYGWTYPENDYNVRKNFNKKFANIENGGAVNKGVAKDENGNNGIGLDYTINNHEAELNNRDYYWKEGWNITADTHRALLDLEAYYRYLRGDSAYNTDDHPVTQVSDITNVNLGLYRREQPDLALVKDIYDIRATINNYDYTYPYNQRFLNQAEYGNGFDNSVKYSDKYSSMGYTRAVYESDYEFIDYKDPYKELQLYVTYKIAIRNQSTSLTSQVNSIVDYYENRYELVGVGTSPEVDKTTRKD